ncbi:MAG: Gfo/Idh/MocA family oxidoreductase [Pseudorhodobacter sp.]|nr:Gfo/Idh/MocA family oxidoreductase [Pseudorhodobacter sp.]
MAARILVVGAGSIGRRHAENLTALGAVTRVLGWRETSADQILDILMAGQTDGLVIATATQTRLDLIAAAGRAKVPFYVEKPLAFTPTGLAAMQAAAKSVAARSMVGFMMRYHPAFRDLARADLSETFRFDLTIGHDVTQWRQNWRFSESYAAKPVGGGVLLDLCHEIDMAACLFPGLSLGPVESMGHAAYPGVDMATRLMLAAPNGGLGSVSMDYLAPKLIRDARLCTPQATYSYDFAAQSYSVTTLQGIETRAFPLERNAMFLDAMRDWLALVEGRPVSGVEHLPRFDLVSESCALIAESWQRRRFIGTMTKEIP